MAMGKKRPSQSQSSSSSISPSNNNNNSTKPISKKKTKKEENLRAKAILHRQQQQQQLNHDGRDDHRPIVRPKVYITDISNFKTLVQELTGNGAPAAAVVPQREPSPASEIFEHEEMRLPMHAYDQSESDSVTTSVDASVDSSGTPSFGHEEMNSFQHYGYYDQMGLYNLEATTTSDDMVACQADLEALLQDMDQQQLPLVFETSYSSESHHQIHHYHQQQLEADLSIYDYDFSGIVC